MVTTAGPSSSCDFCLILEIRVSMYRHIGGMRTCIFEDPFSPGKGAENKFMTRNGNWCVVKAVSYAPCPVEMILSHFEGVRN